jgi:hypothetical protein
LPLAGQLVEKTFHWYGFSLMTPVIAAF